MVHQSLIRHLAVLSVLAIVAGSAAAAQYAPPRARVRATQPVPASPSASNAAASDTPAFASPLVTTTPPLTNARQPVAAENSWSQVNAAQVNLRAGPGTQFPIVATLRAGDVLKARAVQNGWLEVDWPRAIPAWLPKTSVKTTPGSAVATVAGREVSVYSADTTRAPMLAKLQPNDRVTLVGEKGAWYKIAPPESAAAFISAKYVITGVAPPGALPARKEVHNAPAPTAAAQTTVPAAAPATSPAAAKQAVPQAPASVENPDATASTQKPNADLVAAVEETRRQLKASAPANTLTAPTATEPTETDGILTSAREDAQREETARREAETKRLEAEETARRDAEAKRKAEAEEQARREAETKRMEAEETARRDAEAKKKAEAEEQARREAETKRLEAEETARRDAEAKKKAEAEEQARRKAEAEEAARREAAAKVKSDPRGGDFVDPAAAPASVAAPVLPTPPALLVPPAAAVVAPAAPVEPAAPAVVQPLEDETGLFVAPTTPGMVPDPNHGAKGVPAQAEPTPATNAAPPGPSQVHIFDTPAQKGDGARGKYLTPAAAPARPNTRAQVLDDDGGNAQPENTKRPAPKSDIPSPVSFLRIPYPRAAEPASVQAPELPVPAGEPPAAYRLKPFFASQVLGAESDGVLAVAEGVILRGALSPVAGADYVLVRDDGVRSLLTARAGVSLESCVGRRVSITGVALHSPAPDLPVLAVSSASVCD
jgi:uncharacterized protein YgiM (DUF1202 family)